jgi:hypothetical protein
VCPPGTLGTLLASSRPSLLATAERGSKDRPLQLVFGPVELELDGRRSSDGRYAADTEVILRPRKVFNPDISPWIE